MDHVARMKVFILLVTMPYNSPTHFLIFIVMKKYKDDVVLLPHIAVSTLTFT